MTFFDEYGPYWGDKIMPLVGAGDGRLSARSVKIFADGMCPYGSICIGAYL